MDSKKGGYLLQKQRKNVPYIFFPNPLQASGGLMKLPEEGFVRDVRE
jgi:hypothetical protein